jgi:hypothetical protein
MSKPVGRLTFALRMTAAGHFMAALKRERRGGNVCSETEQRLKQAFRTRFAPPQSAFTVAIGSEIERVERRRQLCGTCKPSCSARGSGSRCGLAAGSGTEHGCRHPSNHPPERRSASNVRIVANG